MRAHGEIAVVPEIGAVGALVRGEAGTKQAGGKRGNFRGSDFIAIEGGALAASGCECTGGRDTGFPDKAARIVGLTPGWGMTFAFAICWGVSLIIECATDCPLLNTSPCTAVVAIVR